MNLRPMLDRIRDSLLYVPALFIAASLLLAWITNRLDAATDTSDVFYLLPTSISAARDLLGTVAGATITVAALVFSITAVTVQLSATQYSPRVLQGFLRDRYQQVVVGIVMGTFTYALVSLATAGNALRNPETVDASFAATTGLALGVVSALAIVAFIDHVTRRIRVDDTIRRLTSATTHSIGKVFADAAQTKPSPVDGYEFDHEVTPLQVRAARSGWTQEIRAETLLEALPAGSVARIYVTPGDYVAKGDPLMSVRLPNGAGEIDIDHIGRHAIELGDARTVEDDPRFGIRQLVDIALRALSPGINDPATAADVVRHLVEPMRSAGHHRARRKVLNNEAGTRIALPEQLDASDFIHLGFGEIRLAAADQPLVLKALVDSLSKLWHDLGDEPTTAAGGQAIKDELELVGDAARKAGLAEVDLKPILDVLAGIGVGDGDGEEPSS